MPESLATGAAKAMRDWPPGDADTLYDYGFSVSPDAENPRMRDNQAVWDLFRNGGMCRQVLTFTARQFGDFREELCKVGFVLCEIEKTPHFEPAGVV